MLTTAAWTRRCPPGRIRPLVRDARRGVVVTALAAALALATLAGCAPGPATPPRPAAPPGTRSTPPARTRPAAGYVARRDSLPPADPLLLEGRRVVIDPGHGGYFKGALGVGGLTEAEVNLGVALVLDTLLTERGAAVLLTRTSDRDYLTPADSSLKGDLAERTRRGNAFAPDLFISIHHNADPGGAHDVNETQTYYQLGDDGPAYDAGTDVHRALVRNLGIAGQRLLPGNYAVVRGSEAPALLTESSYLTNPDVEAKLRTPQARRLEAEALLIGITRYFARPAPVIERFAVARASQQGAEGSPGGGFPVLTARVRGGFDEATLRIDDERVAPLVMDDSIYWQAQNALPSGPHTATLSVRLAGEGSSRASTLAFRLAKPLARLVADFPGQPMWSVGSPIGLRVRALDGDGLPLASDTLAVHVRARHAMPADTVLEVRDGVAWGYFRGTPGSGRRAKLQNPDFRVSTTQRFHDEAGTHAPAVVVAGLGRIAGSDPLAPWRTGFAHAMPGDTALRDAPGAGGPAPVIAWLNRDGFVALGEDALRRTRTPRLAGFRAWGADSVWPPRFVAIAGGALAGRHIVLDPEGGGDDTGGVGPSSTRAATLNLEVAHALAGMLTAAGAEVLLTRDGDAAVSEVERVQRGEAFHPVRYLRIGHAAAPPVAGHYFSSGGGKRWGLHLAGTCVALGLTDSLPVMEVAKYALTQTSATALYASLARVDSAGSEARLLAPGTLRREAYALFAALAADFAPESRWETDSFIVRDAAGAPLPGALVTLGGALVLQAGPDGVVRFMRTEPGPLEVGMLDPRATPRRLLLDSTSARSSSGAH